MWWTGLHNWRVDSLEEVRRRGMEWTLKLLLWPLWTRTCGLTVCTCRTTVCTCELTVCTCRPTVCTCRLTVCTSTHRCMYPTLLQDSRASQISLQAPCLFHHHSPCVNVYLPSSHLQIQMKEKDSMIFMFYSVPDIPFSCICSHLPDSWKESRIFLLLLKLGLGKVWVQI